LDLVKRSTTSKTKNKKLHREEEPVIYKHRPPPLLREFTELYRVSLGTSAHKEGAVAVVEE
jgi:hypothetical protein